MPVKKTAKVGVKVKKVSKPSITVVEEPKTEQQFLVAEKPKETWKQGQVFLFRNKKGSTDLGLVVNEQPKLTPEGEHASIKLYLGQDPTGAEVTKIITPAQIMQVL